MGISVIGTVGVPANYGGFESLVENLLPLTDDAVVYCVSSSYEQHLRVYKGAKLVYFPLSANGFQSVFYDILCMLHSLFFTKNHFLILGVSGAVFIPFIRLVSRRLVVTNIDGVEWRRAKWGWVAKNFLRFSEMLAVKFSHKVIADNAAIADYVKSEYGVLPHVIAYGGDHALIKDLISESKNYSLSLCRIEPENNVDMILAAFAKTGRDLIFIGNWDRSAYGRDLKLMYSQYQNIQMIDPIYDLTRLFTFRSECGSYVHGHSAGGTNPSLVEMMFFGKRILCYDCAYNRASTEGKAEYFQTLHDLVTLLDSTRENCGVGDFMREIANRRYRWSNIRESYLALFE